MTASSMQSAWYLMALSWYAVHNNLESQKRKGYLFDDFDDLIYFYFIFSLRLELIIYIM